MNTENSLDVTVYSTTWCPDCRHAKSYLSSKGISYQEVDIEVTDGAAELIAEHNHGKHVVPTIKIGDQFYGNPSLKHLGELVAAS